MIRTPASISATDKPSRILVIKTCISEPPAVPDRALPAMPRGDERNPIKSAFSAVPGLVCGTVGGGIVIPDKYSHPYLCRTQIILSLCCKFVLLFVNISVD